MSYTAYDRSAGTRSAFAEHFRTLGVNSNASWEDVRQAYKDLVRVWHPDRFQSDPQLRDRAQQHMQKINDAYRALEASQVFDDRAEPPPAAPHPDPPRTAAPRASTPPPNRPPRRPFAWVWGLPVGRLMLLGFSCVMPLLFGGLMLNSLRVPALDPVAMQTGMARPALLMPSRMIDPLDRGTSGATALGSWAREAAGLWKALPGFGSKSGQPVPDPAQLGFGSKDEAPAAPPPQRAAAPVAPVMPVNGTEVLWTKRTGAGELWIVNETGKDALATLVQSRTTEPLRAIYVQAKSKACLRNVAVGVVDLVAEVGEDWDPRKFRFRSGRQSLGRSGPFNFFELASAQGSAGQKYDIVLRAR